MQQNEGITKHILEFKPIIYKEDISYVRQEKEGAKSIAFKSWVNSVPILFSKVEADFIELCNGRYTVCQIVEKVCAINQNVPWMICMSLSTSLLSFLTEIEILGAEDINPFLKNKVLQLDESTDVVDIPYFKIDQCRQFINKAFLNRDKFYFYTNPLVGEISCNSYSFNRYVTYGDKIVQVINNEKEIAMFIFKFGKSVNELILDCVIIEREHINNIRLSSLNELFDYSNLRIAIYTLDDKTPLNIFKGNIKEEIFLRFEMKDGQDLNETNFYYLNRGDTRSDVM